MLVRALRMAAVAAAFVLPLSAAAQSCVWFGGKDVLSQVPSGGSAVAVSVPVGDASRIGMNSSDCGVWALGRNQLHRYDAAGALANSFELQAIDRRLDLATQIAVDPYDGSVWIAGNKVLVHLSSTGTVLATPVFDGIVRSMAVGLDQSVWILGDMQISRFSAVGTAQPVIDLRAPTVSEPKQLAVDSIGKVAWVATNKSVLRIKFDGAQPTAIRTSDAIVGIALDPVTSRLWVADAASLHVYDATGALVQSVAMASLGLTKAESIAFDAIGKALWVWTKEGAARLSPEGTLQASFPAQIGSGLLAVPAFAVQPAITLVEPPQDAITNNAYRNIAIGYDAQCNGQPCGFAPSYLASYSLSAVVNGQEVGPKFVFDANAKQANYTPTAKLPEGPNTLQAQAKDGSGRLSNAVSGQFTVDTVPPVVTITSPANGAVTNQAAQNVSGTVNETASVLVNILAASVSASGTFTASVTLQEGSNSINVVAVDRASNTGSAQVGMTLDTQPPAAPVVGSITVSTPMGGRATVSAAPGAVEAGSAVTITNSRSGVSASTTAAANGSFSLQIAASGGEALNVVVADAATNRSAPVTVNVPGGLPPDPATVATPIDTTVPTRLGPSLEFLYSGSNPVQTGVAPGTIETKRVAVLRGKVGTRDGEVLPGVRISVVGHPEYGHTLSRADGVYDLAVNGGGALTVKLELAGYLSAFRTVQTPWSDFVPVPEVLLVRADPKVTTISLPASSPQVVQGSASTDESGSRRVTMIFPADVTASMSMPDGSTRALPTLSVRATEYTVGPNGEKAMPATLPQTTDYTYAAELSVDEAEAAGARGVLFNKAVPVYVDNFINMPVGVSVPVAYYDKEASAWIPSNDGRVIAVLAVANGLAVLDVNGQGHSATDMELQLLGVSEAERVQLAGLYSPGKTVWRVPVNHFSPYDFNWGLRGQARPTGCDASGRCIEPVTPTSANPCKVGGCIIEAENRVLGERIEIEGAPYGLSYRSSRAEGFIAPSTLRIPLTSSEVLDSLTSVRLEVHVAGQSFTRTFPPLPDQTYEHKWDGKDAYGRKLAGRQRVSVRIGYTHNVPYLITAESLSSANATLRSWGYPGVLEGVIGRYEATVWLDATSYLDAPISLDADVAGWSVDVHHTYDPRAGRLYLGDGSMRNVGTMAIDAYTQPPFLGFLWSQLATDARGNVLLNGRVRVPPSGPAEVLHSFTTFAGAFRGDDVYFTAPIPFSGVTIFKMVGGKLPHIPIGWYPGTLPAGQTRTRAHDTRMFANQMVVDAEGSVYYSEHQNLNANGSSWVSSCYVKKITPAGDVLTVAGTGSCMDDYSGSRSGDDGPAIQARFHLPTNMLLDREGNLYVADKYTVRRVSRGGIISTVAGTWTGRDESDGRPATQVWLGAFPQGVTGLAFDASGDLLIATFTRVLRLGKDGILRTVLGSNDTSCTVNNNDVGAPAVGTCKRGLRGLATDPAGNMFVLEETATNVRTLRKVAASEGKAVVADVIVPSADVSQLYVFNNEGRHVRTLDAKLKSVIHDFEFDSAGRLTGIRDAAGALTEIQRGDAGQPVRIKSPDGLITGLTVGSDKQLAAVSNPAGETYAMEYTQGLLKRFTKPSGASNVFTYDELGRLSEDRDAAGGGWSIAEDTHRVVTMTSAERRSTVYKTISANEKAITAADGTLTRIFTSDDGASTFAADGTKFLLAKAPDPRFGMQADFAKQLTTVLPSGLTSTQTKSVVVTTDGGLLNVNSQVEKVSLNGRTYTTTFQGGTRQYTQTTPLNRSTIVGVDAQGRLVLTRIAGVQDVNYAYDVRGRMIGISQGSGAQTRTSSFAYDAQGRLASITDSADRVTTFAYDLAGRVSRETLPDGRVIDYTYDANGNLTSVTPPGRPRHGFAYNAVDLQQEYAPPVVSGVAAPATRYAYNLDKQLTSITRPDSRVVQFGYDAGGRLATVTAPEGVISYAYTPDKGTLAGITAPGGVQLGYTHDGFLLLSETWSGPVSGSVARAYNNDFDLKTLNVGGKTYTYTYDNDRLLTGAGSLSITRSATNGFITGTQLGSVATSQSYSDFGELQQAQAMLGTTTLLAQTYAYDKLGRIVQKSEQVQGQTDSYGYEYDSAGRLQAVTKNGAPLSTYQYDGNGNRISDGVNQASYDEQDRLVQYGSAIFSYTDNGELRSKKAGDQETRYDYDVLGNLRKALMPDGKAIEYVIDGRNRRVGKKVNGTLVQGLLYLDQLEPVVELDGNNNVLSRFIYGTKQHVPDYMEKGGKTYRIVSDHLGSVRVVVDTGTGQVVQRMDYDAFGYVIQDTNPGFQPFGFAGGIYDYDTKLTRFGARDYDALTGRWTAKDPIMFDGGDTNLFAYVEGNPLSLIDPTGLMGRGSGGNGAGGSAGPSSSSSLSVVGNSVAAGGALGAGSGAVAGGIFGAAAGAAEGAHLGALAGLAAADGLWSGALAGGVVGAAVGAVGGLVVGTVTYYARKPARPSKPNNPLLNRPKTNGC